MELLTMDDRFNSVKMVENYKSLIWTERYSQPGDFQLTSASVEETMALLPRESFVRLRDSTVPMVVEDYKIENKPKNNEGPLITVTGRSFETVLERRVAVSTALTVTTPRPAWMIPASKSSDAAYLAMRIVLGDIARSGFTAVPPALSPYDAFKRTDSTSYVDLTVPADFQAVVVNKGVWSASTAYAVNDVVTYTIGTGATAVTNTYKALVANTNVAPTDVTKWQSLMVEVKPSDLYSAMQEMLAANHHGLKAVLLGNGMVGLEIYNGRNMTGSGANSDPNRVVVFDARFDQFDSSSYLFSQRGSANVGYVYGYTGGRSVLKTTPDPTHPEPSGLARRVLIVDAKDDQTVNSAEIMNSRGLIELYKYNATALYAGEVSVQVADGYNRDYFLGDIIKLTGEYAGLSESVRVAEFIRSSDSTGEKSYPTFQSIEDDPTTA